MAVRDDFAAGEVLAAADLNDTFASKLPYSYGTATPSTTDSGFLWYDSNSTPPVPKYWDGSAFANLVPDAGLNYIDQYSASAASALSINGCFTSTYLNYRVVISVGGGSATASINLRLRASGSDNTASVHKTTRQGYRNDTGTEQAQNTTATNYTLLTDAATDTSRIVIDVFNPQTVSSTAMLARGVRLNGSGVIGFLDSCLVHSSNTAFDGFSIYVSSGTANYTATVYGYKD